MLFMLSACGVVEECPEPVPSEIYLDTLLLDELFACWGDCDEDFRDEDDDEDFINDALADCYDYCEFGGGVNIDVVEDGVPVTMVRGSAGRDFFAALEDGDIACHVFTWELTTPAGTTVAPQHAMITLWGTNQSLIDLFLAPDIPHNQVLLTVSAPNAISRTVTINITGTRGGGMGLSETPERVQFPRRATDCRLNQRPPAQRGVAPTTPSERQAPRRDDDVLD